MSTKTTRDSLTEIADTALDQLRCDKEYAAWIDALMRAIQTDAKHNNGRDAAKLAGLGQYLAEDMRANVEGTVSHLETQLDAVEDAA